MTKPNALRVWVKSLMRPLFAPLVRRFRLPFVIMLPRIERLERLVDPFVPFDQTIRRIETLEGDRQHFGRIDKLEVQVADLSDRSDFITVGMFADTTQALRASLSNLTRAWMRQEQELAHSTARLNELDQRTAPAELERTLVEPTRRQLTELVEARSAASDARVSAAEATARAVETHVDAVERRLQDSFSATEGRGARVDDTLRFLLDRVEFVRRELMFELRYGAREASAGASSAELSPRVLEPEKVSAARAAGQLRINLGCGHIIAPDYINVDMRDLPGVDVVAAVGRLPFDPESVDEISSAHLVEHFPQEELRRRLLPYWRKLLKPGGTFRAVTPDGAAMLSGVADGSYTFQDFRDVLFGGQDYDGDFHYNLLTPDSLRDLVTEAGFENVEIPVRGRRNGQCFEFELVARVPPSVS